MLRYDGGLSHERHLINNQSLQTRTTDVPTAFFFFLKNVWNLTYTQNINRLELYLCIQKMTVSHKNVNKSKRQAESVEEVQTMTKKEMEKGRDEEREGGELDRRVLRWNMASGVEPGPHAFFTSSV